MDAGKFDRARTARSGAGDRRKRPGPPDELEHRGPGEQLEHRGGGERRDAGALEHRGAAPAASSIGAAGGVEHLLGVTTSELRPRCGWAVEPGRTTHAILVNASELHERAPTATTDAAPARGPRRLGSTLASELRPRPPPGGRRRRAELELELKAAPR